MKSRILIPIVHVPSEQHWRHPEITIPALRLVPHFTHGINGREGDADLPTSIGRGGFEVAAWIGKEQYPCEWIPEPRWTGGLTVVDYHGGRSSSCYAVRITADDGAEPVEGLMSCYTFLPLLPRLVAGIVQGTWTARKQGQNYLMEEVPHV